MVCNCLEFQFYFFEQVKIKKDIKERCEERKKLQKRLINKLYQNNIKQGHNVKDISELCHKEKYLETWVKWELVVDNWADI